MYRRILILAAAVSLGSAATHVAVADVRSDPRATAAQGGVSVSPSILEATARQGASGTVTVTNRSGRSLRVTARPRPWRQARSGRVTANRGRSLGGVRARPSRFTLAPGGVRRVRVTMTRVPSRVSVFGALEVVGRPTVSGPGINVTYRLISSLRFNPVGAARRLSLRAGSAVVSGGALGLLVRNRGNTVDPVSGSYRISGAGSGRSGGIAAVRVLPGSLVSVRLGSLSGLRSGSYRVSVTLTQAGRARATASRRFRIR
jgi:hypothetical protein